MILRLLYFLKDFRLFIGLFLAVFLAESLFFYLLFKSSWRKKAKIISLTVLGFIFWSFVLFCISEAYFRYVYDESDGLGFLKVDQAWHRRHVVYNGDFMRDREFKQKKQEGVTKIGVIGDSITFGAGIKDPQKRFSNLLEEELNSTGTKAEVYNMGVVGLDSKDIKSKQEHIKSFNFDIIVWQYFFNDIGTDEDVLTRTKIIQKYRRENLLIAKITQKSYLADFLFWRITQRYAKSIADLQSLDFASYRNNEKFKDHEKVLDEVLAEFKSGGAKVVVIVFPPVNMLGPNYPLWDINVKLKDYFASRNIEGFIDLTDDLANSYPQELEAGKFDAHPNEKVHALAADRLFKVIDKLVHSEK